MRTNQSGRIKAERIREISGEEDVEWLDVLPDRIRYMDEDLRPRAILRVAEVYFVEAVQYPGEWWMGSLVNGNVIVWGSYGRLEEAIRSR